MANEEHAGEDATEAPTQKRLDRARESGKLPLSRDVPVLASLAGAAVGLLVLAPALAAKMTAQMGGLLASVHTIQATAAVGDGQVAAMVLTALELTLAVALPVAILTIGSVMLQSGFYFGGTAIRFDPSRISPFAGLGRVLSIRNLLEFLKSCARLVILSAIIWSVFAANPLRSLPTMRADVASLFGTLAQEMVGLVKPLLIMLFVLAVADVFLVRYRHLKQMRMTREEVRREHKESEGDPYIKAKVRMLRQQRSRRRMMAKVKTAAVVITNPTHYAIALAYDRGRQDAPRIVAKGADFIAARIREEAELHRVPLVENAPLARALYALDLDTEIPAEHYQAVAEIIAFVWKLRGRTTGTVE
jgi:flagellar biosynthetic protein FlhB